MVEAMKLADQLREYNLDRRNKEQEIFNEAESQIYETVKMAESSSLLIYGKNWHQGVIGNVASRIAREYNRASIVHTIIDDYAYGSGRGSSKINLVSVLSECSDLLTRYGGHPMAVGLSLKQENVPELKIRFENAVRKVFTPQDLIPQIDYDGEISISELTDAFYRELENLEPFGHSNAMPIYRLSNLSVPHLSNSNSQHSKGYLRDSSGRSIPFIAFNVNPSSLPPQPWDILAIPQLNDYHGSSQPQLRLVDVKSSHI